MLRVVTVFAPVLVTLVCELTRDQRNCSGESSVLILLLAKLGVVIHQQVPLFNQH